MKNNLKKFFIKIFCKKRKSKNKVMDKQTAYFIYALGGIGNIINICCKNNKIFVDLKQISYLDKNNFQRFNVKDISFINDNTIEIVFKNNIDSFFETVNFAIKNNLSFPEIDACAIKKKPQSSLKIKDFKEFDVMAPCDGIIYYLKDIKNEQFKSQNFDKGIALIIKDTKIFSPINNAIIKTKMQNKNEFILENDQQFQLMLQIGLKNENKNNDFIVDTSIENEKISTNKQLISLNDSDPSKLISVIMPIVFLNFPDNAKVEIKVKNRQLVKRGDILMNISKQY